MHLRHATPDVVGIAPEVNAADDTVAPLEVDRSTLSTGPDRVTQGDALI